MITLYNDDNIKVMRELKRKDIAVDAIYADSIYTSSYLAWTIFCCNILKDNGVFIIQADYHTVADYVTYMKFYTEKCGWTFVNWLIYINDWGGTPKNRFAQKHDDILVYCKGNHWKWYPERIQIPKVTAGTAFDKKGTGLKTPCSVFYDHASFSTMSKERVKMPDGHNISMQKPMWLMNRLLLPFTDEGDLILEPFGGTFPACRWAKENNRNAIGIELRTDILNLSKELGDEK